MTQAGEYRQDWWFVSVLFDTTDCSFGLPSFPSFLTQWDFPIFSLIAYEITICPMFGRRILFQAVEKVIVNFISPGRMLFWKINPDGLDNIWESYLGFGFKFIDIIAYSDIYLDKLQKIILISKYVLIMFSGMTISVVSCGFDSDNMDFVEIEH